MKQARPSPVELAVIKGVIAELSQHGHPYSEVAALLGCSKSSIGMLIKHDRFCRSWDVGDTHRKLADYLANLKASGELKRLADAPVAQKKEANMLYEPLRAKTLQHFGWDSDPFRVNVMTDEIWMNADRKYAVDMIEETCEEHGFTALIGQSGSGKSVVLKTAAKRLARSNRNTVIRTDPMMNEDLTAGRIIDSMLIQLKLPAEGSHAARRERLKYALLKRLADDKRTLLVLEEAQSLKPLALRWLKRVFEMEDEGGRRLVGILLVGQPGLNGRSKGLAEELEYTPELAEVAGRLAIVTMNPLDEQLGDYLRWRIRKAGERAAGVFSGGALKAMKDRLNGATHPMMINVLACRCLNEAATQNDDTVEAKHVMAA